MYTQTLPGPRATPPGPGRLRASGRPGGLFAAGRVRRLPFFLAYLVHIPCKHTPDTRTSHTYHVHTHTISQPSRTHTTYHVHIPHTTYTYHIPHTPTAHNKPRTHTTYHVQAQSYRMTIQTMTLQSLNQQVTRLNHSKGLGRARGQVPGARARSQNEDPTQRRVNLRAFCW